MNIRQLLDRMVELDASDLHLKAGSPPGLRVHGTLRPVEGWDVLDAASCRALVFELLDPEQIEALEHDRDLDLSVGIDGLARFRVNVFHQRGSCAAVLRKIPIDVPELEQMGFADILPKLCDRKHGLIVVTGPTGSGKSTTLAAMVDYINRNKFGHILTLEDPIEFVHPDKRCYVNQREIGADTKTFSTALRAALREDPDYILVGEMRDQETISLAITAAETGHMVFGTLHTTSAIQTVDRMIDVFPHESQAQIRTQLSITLQGVISQNLLPKVGGGRACAQEVMIGTDAVRSCIRDGKTPQLINQLQTGQNVGMQTLEMHLAKLVRQGLVTLDDALAKANYPNLLRQRLEADGGAPAPAANGARATRGTRTESSRPKASSFEAFRANRARR